jgi:hypothetical protein
MVNVVNQINRVNWRNRNRNLDRKPTSLFIENAAVC